MFGKIKKKNVSVRAPRYASPMGLRMSLKVSGIQNSRFQPTSKSNITFLTSRDLNLRPLEYQGYYVRPKEYKHKNQTPLNYLAQAASCLTNWHPVPTKGWGSWKRFDINPAQLFTLIPPHDMVIQQWPQSLENAEHSKNNMLMSP